MSKIEEVARAIREASPSAGRGDSHLRSQMLTEAACLDLARAAIEANAKPSTAMIDAGVAFALNVKLGGEYTWSRYVADLYEHMTRAALREEGR